MLPLTYSATDSSSTSPLTHNPACTEFGAGSHGLIQFIPDADHNHIQPFYQTFEAFKSYQLSAIRLE